MSVTLWRMDIGSHRWQSVCAVTFSPDGRTLAAGLYRGTSFNKDFHWCIGNIGQTVVLYDADNGEPRGMLADVRFDGMSWGLPSTPLGQFLGFSPDGRTLAAATWDGTVQLWNVETKQLAKTLRAQRDRLTAVSFSGDGRKLAAGCRDSFTLWDTAGDGDGWQLETATTKARSIAFSPDAKWIAVGSEHSFQGAEVWEVTAGRRKGNVPIAENGVLALQFGSNGRYLAMGGRKTALLWDLGEDRVRFEVEAPWTVAVALSPDCETLATAGAYGLRFWRTATGEPTGAFGPERRIQSLAYSPDGRLLAAGDSLGYVTVWDTNTGRERWSARADGPSRVDLTFVLSAIVAVGLLSITVLRRCWNAQRRFGCAPAFGIRT